MQRDNHITILGTGNALATRCYSTCFTLHSSGGALLMVDAGGGNGILAQLEKAEIKRENIQDLFVSHKKVIDLLTYICRAVLPPKEADGSQWDSNQNSSTCLSSANADFSQIVTALDGIANTNTLVSDGHTHAAASAARNYSVPLPAAGTSGWFLPSIGQWNLIVGAERINAVKPTPSSTMSALFLPSNFIVRISL